MCSIGDDIEDFASCSTNISLAKNEKLPLLCKKCNEKSVLLLQKKDPFCRACFFEYCNHKFRATIGKSKQLKNGTRVLLACSGGRKSTALLHMTKQTLESASLKQINFEPGILFINESFLVPEIDDENNEVLSILEYLKCSRIDVLYSSLEMVHKINTDEQFYWPAENLNSDIMYNCSISRNKILENISDLTISTKLDLIKHLRLLLMSEVAYHAGYNYLFVGDSATSLAVELLCDIALGRGSQISPDTSFYDTRYKVPICRPIREFLDKEILFFNHLKNHSFKVLPNLLTKTRPTASIQRLTENFVTNLQESFPATIFTIFRTGGKLLKNDSSENDTCVLCKSKLDNANPEACSALEALSLSEKLSTPNYSSEETTEEMKSFSNVKIEKVTDVNKSINFTSLCHGCSNSFQKIINKTDFYQIFHPTKTAMDRSKMKNEIKEFLLDENEENS